MKRLSQNPRSKTVRTTGNSATTSIASRLTVIWPGLTFALHIRCPLGMIRMETTMAPERIPSYPKNAPRPLDGDAAADAPAGPGVEPGPPTTAGPSAAALHNRFLALLKSRRARPMVVAHRGDSFHAPENT